VAMTVYNLKLAVIYLLILGVCYSAFKLFTDPTNRRKPRGTLI